ncbi:MAG: UvrB/UvrC motif-containing protein [Puniceicoccaceae bacterium]
MKEDVQQSHSGPKIYLTKIIGGKVFSTVLPKGAAAESLLHKPGYALIEQGEGLGRVTAVASVRCPSCGYSKERFEKSGRLGCPDCYQSFAPFLKGIIGKMHAGPRHVGKVPPGRLTPAVVDARVKALSEELDKAVRVEKYEEAARIRDEIRTLAGATEATR